MNPTLASLVLAVLVFNSPAAARQEPGATYHSAKTLPALQKCLTDKLANVGEVVAVKADKDTTTLVLRDIAEGPMTIDLEPPSVTVTSKFVHGTRHLVEACL